MTAPPPGIRDNDPFNLNYLAAINWQGEEGADGRFNIFDTTVDGLRAGLISTCNHVLKDGCAPTIKALIALQAPPIENDTEAYERFMCEHMGVQADDTINIHDATTMAAYARGIVIQENDEVWASTITDGEITQAVTEAFLHLYGAAP